MPLSIHVLRLSMRSEGAKMEQEKIRKYKQRSQWQEVWRRLKTNKGAILGAIFVLILIFCMLFADQLYDYDTQIVKQNISQRLLDPSWEHPFGTDEYGRDLFARLVYGTKASLPIGFVAVLFAMVFGILFGSIAGYYGGAVDNVIMRCIDILRGVPSVLLAIAIVAILGEGTKSLMIAVGVSNIAIFARIVRAAVLTVRNSEFIESARAIGKNSFEIIFQHVLPNCLSPIIVQASLRIGQSIILAAGLSYLGLGVQPPTPEWGSLLSAGRTYMRDHSNLTVFPGLVIMLSVISFNLIGDGLRDSMDPKLRK